MSSASVSPPPSAASAAQPVQQTHVDEYVKQREAFHAELKVTQEKEAELELLNIEVLKGNTSAGDAAIQILPSVGADIDQNRFSPAGLSQIQVPDSLPQADSLAEQAQSQTVQWAADVSAADSQVRADLGQLWPQGSAHAKFQQLMQVASISKDSLKNAQALVEAFKESDEPPARLLQIYGKPVSFSITTKDELVDMRTDIAARIQSEEVDLLTTTASVIASCEPNGSFEVIAFDVLSGELDQLPDIFSLTVTIFEKVSRSDKRIPEASEMEKMALATLENRRAQAAHHGNIFHSALPAIHEHIADVRGKEIILVDRKAQFEALHASNQVAWQSLIEQCAALKSPLLAAKRELNFRASQIEEYQTQALLAQLQSEEEVWACEQQLKAAMERRHKHNSSLKYFSFLEKVTQAEIGKLLAHETRINTRLQPIESLDHESNPNNQAFLTECQDKIADLRECVQVSVTKLGQETANCNEISCRAVAEVKEKLNIVEAQLAELEQQKEKAKAENNSAQRWTVLTDIDAVKKQKSRLQDELSLLQNNCRNVSNAAAFSAGGSVEGLETDQLFKCYQELHVPQPASLSSACTVLAKPSEGLPADMKAFVEQQNALLLDQIKAEAFKEIGRQLRQVKAETLSMQDMKTLVDKAVVDGLASQRSPAPRQRTEADEIDSQASLGSWLDLKGQHRASEAHAISVATTSEMIAKPPQLEEIPVKNKEEPDTKDIQPHTTDQESPKEETQTTVAQDSATNPGKLRGE